MLTPTTRRFVLMRSIDHTGVSGFGPVADGVQFDDNLCVLRWRGAHRSTVIWPSLDDLVAIHGHDGATSIHWHDNQEGTTP